MAHVLLTDNDVQVAGLDTFPGNGWRGAILAFVAGMVSGTIGRPKINFGCLTLRLSEDGYFAYGKGRDLNHPFPPRSDKVIRAFNQTEIEDGLLQFAKEKRIKQLHIVLRTGSIILWKKKGDQYGCWTDDAVPESWRGLGCYVPEVHHPDYFRPAI